VDALEAIRLRRSVRRYTSRPVADADLDQLLRLALLAPTGSMAQAWSLIVVRDPEKRRALADIVISGGAAYFASVRRPAEGVGPEEHAQWARDYAAEVMGTYPDVPVWIVALRVPRRIFPPGQEEYERIADLLSIGFAMENLFVAARALGLGTVPVVFHWYREEELRSLLDIPAEYEIPVITPLGYPVEFPSGLPPALARIRRPWRTLVHDDRWGNPRQQLER
jgi:nitroreductase